MATDLHRLKINWKRRYMRRFLFCIELDIVNNKRTKMKKPFKTVCYTS